MIRTGPSNTSRNGSPPTSAPTAGGRSRPATSQPAATPTPRPQIPAECSSKPRCHPGKRAALVRDPYVPPSQPKARLQRAGDSGIRSGLDHPIDADPDAAALRVGDRDRAHEDVAVQPVVRPL